MSFASTHVCVCISGALAENGRLTQTMSIINAFGKIMSAHRGEVTCVVTSSKVCNQVVSLV